MDSRLKFYGWGVEDTGLDEAERQRLFRFLADRLGVEPRLVAPPQVADVSLRAPRVAAARHARPRAHGRSLRAAPAHLRQVLPGDGPRLGPRLRQCAGPRRPSCERSGRRCRARLGERGERRRHSLRVRLLGRRRRRAGRRRPLRRRRQPRSASARPCPRGRRDQPRRAHPGRHPGPGDRGGAEAARPRDPALPAELRVLHARRLDRDPRRAGTSPRSTPISTTSSKASAPSRPRASWSRAACPARAPGQAPTA